MWHSYIINCLKKASFSLYLVFIHAAVYGQETAYIRLSDRSQISVITMGPDLRELYAAFGHNAIRVYDPVNEIDLAYNYGTFDFDQPNFYLNFARGDLLYKLSVYDYSQLKRFYIYYNRFIHEQVLDLDPGQRQRVFNYLEQNARPENASYNYDYFYDNCATRIRDVFVDVFEDSIRFDGSYIFTQETVRELTDHYLLGKFHWGDLGIDFCLGMPMDKPLSPYEDLYILDYIESGFKHAWLTRPDGSEIPVVKAINVEFKSTPTQSKTIITPLLVFTLLLVTGIAITWVNWNKQKKGKYIDFGLFFFTGFLGIFLTLLWFATNHAAAARNLNILWAFPPHIVMAFLILREIKHPFIKYYFRTTVMVMVLLLISWKWQPQMLHFSLIPVIMMITLRAAWIGWGSAYNK